MVLWKPDPSFYPSPRMAMQAPPERHAYVVGLNVGRNDRPDVLNVVDLDPHSSTYSQNVNILEMPYAGDEFHHFGWNACSSALCPYAPHPHLERRYLIVPGMRSSRIYIIDTKPDPVRPKIVKSYRTGGNPLQNGLQPPAYCALRTGRHLYQRPRVGQGWHLGRAASSCWITSISTLSVHGSFIAAIRPCRMTSGGIWRTTS